MHDAVQLARLRQAFGGEYVIAVRHGILWAVRCDGTTPLVFAPDLTALRAGIAANRRLRYRIAA